MGFVAEVMRDAQFKNKRQKNSGKCEKYRISTAQSVAEKI